MSKSDELIERRHQVVPRGVGQFAGSVTAAQAQGARLVDADGRELIDFAGGIGVVNVGHCHPKVVEAIREQAGRLTHTCIHVATYEPYVALCEKLVELLPHGPSTKAMLLNSGAEAVENAIKIARQATGRPAVLCYSEAFHGRTMMGMALTSKTGYKMHCGPFAPEVYRLPFPNRFRYGDDLPEDDFIKREIDRLEDFFLTGVAADHVAAIILETVQGEGGFVPVPVDYLRGLRRICDERGIVLILDEVQSGFGRTGRWAAYEHYGVTPDISTWAKSMGGGLPIAAVIGKAEIMNAALPGTLGGTYGGNPISCAAALATIGAMEDEKLNERGAEIGRRTFVKFRELQKQCSLVADVRGLGAMAAFELCFHKDPQKPATAATNAVAARCLEQGVVVLPCSPHGNVIRVLSPLTISWEDLERGLEVLCESVIETAREAISAA